MQLGEGTYQPEEHRAMTAAVRIRASYRKAHRGLSIIDPLVVYSDEEIPYIVYYPATDRVELDPVMWKHGAGQYVTTIH